MQKTTKEKYAGAQTVSRAFRLVDLFDDRHPIWSLAELIKASGLKRTTVFRLMAALEAEGIVRKLPTSNYTLGSKLIALGGRAIRANPLRAVARPFLQELTNLTTESSIVDVLLIEDGRPESMAVEEVLGYHLLGMVQYIGSHFPAHATSTGKVLLAFQSSENLSHLDLSHLKRFTKHTITDSARLMEELADVRQKGYATTMNELEEGVMAIAAPIFNAHGEVVAALNTSGPRSRISPERLHSLAVPLKAAALQISQQIGYEP
ncbi:MAG: IclR family transcriptional regulator [Ardenticatenaceae bacterium]